MSEFKEEINIILKDLEKVLISKNLDYGNSFDSQMNEFGLVAGVIRLNDKLNRLKQLSKEDHSQQVNDESLYDTVKDTAGYAVLLMRWLDMEKKSDDKI